MKLFFNFNSKIHSIFFDMELRNSPFIFSYDSVDRIILHDVSHTINGIKVDVEKTLAKVTSTCKDSIQ